MKDYSKYREKVEFCLRIRYLVMNLYLGNKYCARDGTRLFSPASQAEAEAAITWLQSQTTKFYAFTALTGYIFISCLITTYTKFKNISG